MRRTAAIVCAFALACCCTHGIAQMNESLVYVGTYTGTDTGSEGIYVFRLQTSVLHGSQDLALVPMGLAAEAPNPSFLHVDEKRRLIFAVNEIDTFEGKSAGAVSAFKVNDQTSRLTLINRKSSLGAGPCQLVLDKTGRHILVANYGGGSVAVLPVADDGTLGDASDFIQHRGGSINPQRQEGPHAHCVTLDPDNRRAYVCDLGTDKVMIYRFDAGAGKLAPNDPPYAQVKPGAGPRQMVFRPDGTFAYVVNELDSTVTAFAVDSRTGALKELETLSTLPDSHDGPNTASGIGIHPSGRFLYASNRGHDSLVLYEIDRDSGKLRWIDAPPSGGKTPRHFGIDPSAGHLAVANQDSGMVLVSRINAGAGRLDPSGAFAKCPTPTCAVFLSPGDSAKPSPERRGGLP